MSRIIKLLLEIYIILSIALFDIVYLPEKYVFYLKNFLAKIILLQPDLRNYLELLNTPFGFITLIVAPLAVGLIWELAGFNKVQKNTGKRYIHRFHRIPLTHAI